MSDGKYKEIDKILLEITKSNNGTELSRTLAEIESNKDYITNVQLKKLIKLHDKSFKEKCIVPTKELHDEYNTLMESNGNLQNEAALVDRNLRIIEATLELLREKK